MRKQRHCWGQATKKNHHAYVVIAYKELTVTFSTPKGSPLKRSDLMIQDMEIMQAFIKHITT